LNTDAKNSVEELRSVACELREGICQQFGEGIRFEGSTDLGRILNMSLGLDHFVKDQFGNHLVDVVLE
jgi:hypothetical protein